MNAPVAVESLSETDLANMRTLWNRVEAGIRWVDAHSGSLGQHHLWFEARILPDSRMPSKTPEERAAYKEYYRQRLLFERLWLQMEAMEKKLNLTPAQINELGGEATTPCE